MRVFVLSAYPAVRAGLVALVRAEPGSEVVGEEAPAALARAAASGLPQPLSAAPEVVLADLDPEATLEAVATWLAALRPLRGMVALVPLPPTPERARQRGDTPATRLATAVAQAAESTGLAYGLLRRDAPTEEITAALRAVGDGLVALDRTLSQVLLADALTSHPQGAAPLPGEEPLTAREIEVLQLLAQGLPNKLIAQRLHISEHTAKYHVSAILTKLGAASRTEAVTLAARRGLLIL